MTPRARSYGNPISPGNYLKNKGFTGEELDRLSESYSRYQNEQNMLQVRKNAENWDKLAIELVEGVGEISKNKLAAIGNLVIQTSLFAENSDFEQDVNALVQTGISEEEAKRTIYKQYVAELEYASVLEYLSDYLDD